MIQKDIDVSLLNELFNEYKENYKVINNDFIHNYCYVIDNKIIGFIIYSTIYENTEIIDIFVSKDYRNKKIGYELLNKVLEENKNNNITLEVNVNNSIAINLYKKLNFEVVATRKGYYNGVDAYLMLKK